MKNNWYIQVRLARSTKDGTTEMVSWVPEIGTNKVKVSMGSVIQVEGYEGTWKVIGDPAKAPRKDVSYLNEKRKEQRDNKDKIV